MHVVTQNKCNHVSEESSDTRGGALLAIQHVVLDYMTGCIGSMEYVKLGINSVSHSLCIITNSNNTKKSWTIWMVFSFSEHGSSIRIP